MLRRNLAETSSPDYTTTLTSDVIPLTRNGETFLRRDPGALTLNASGYKPGAGEIVTFKLILVFTGKTVPTFPASWIWDGGNAPSFVNPGIYVISVTQPQEAVYGETWLASLEQVFEYSEQLLGVLAYRSKSAGTLDGTDITVVLEEDYGNYNVVLPGGTAYNLYVVEPTGGSASDYTRRGFMATIQISTAGTDPALVTFDTNNIKWLDFEGLWRKVEPGKIYTIQVFSFDGGNTVYGSLCGWR